MNSFQKKFIPFSQRMEVEGLPRSFIDTFAYYYELLTRGQTGLIPEAEIQPVSILTDADSLSIDLVEAGIKAKSKTVVIKLNGGLGTSMGLSNAKSLLPIKNGLTFLDIIAQQAIHSEVPLVLMNSFATINGSLRLLKKYPNLVGELPQSFLQHKEPKIFQHDLSPAIWPSDPQLEWCPPGHGDIYAALVTSGTLQALLEDGYKYAFVSNADNLGAVLDYRILGYFSQHNFPFMMEVADRTDMDKKGGHLAMWKDGRYLLRESAQCPTNDILYFQDINRHKYFNTNNLWLNLIALQRTLAENHGQLRLPMIRNSKTIDPRDPSSPPVFQLETAMGSAIEIFPGATALKVPRSRFAPVKKTDDLLAVRSDAYRLTDDFHIVPAPSNQGGIITVELDPAYFKYVSDVDSRFPSGPPSLNNCSSISITGDFKFGANVVCSDVVVLENRSDQTVVIPAGSSLSGNYRY